MAFEDRLISIRRNFETGDTPQEIVETLDAHVQWLLENNVEQQALAVGQTARINLPVKGNSGFQSLLDFAHGDYLILTWFRGDW